MDVLKHADLPLEKWREGVLTQMRMSYLLGGRQLCIFDQFCDPGLGAPTHIHAVEEFQVLLHVARLDEGADGLVQRLDVGDARGVAEGPAPAVLA